MLFLHCSVGLAGGGARDGDSAQAICKGSCIKVWCLGVIDGRRVTSGYCKFCREPGSRMVTSPHMFPHRFVGASLMDNGQWVSRNVCMLWFPPASRSKACAGRGANSPPYLRRGSGSASRRETFCDTWGRSCGVCHGGRRGGVVATWLCVWRSGFCV